MATARVLALEDETHEARRLAREAVDLAPPAMLNLGADLRVDLAEILHASGDHEEATRVAGEASASTSARETSAPSGHARSWTREPARTFSEAGRLADVDHVTECGQYYPAPIAHEVGYFRRCSIAHPSVGSAVVGTGGGIVERPADTDRFETIVIGGGQAGLATGYQLARRGLSFVILDASDRIGDSWRNRWDSLRLFTPARYDSLPGMSFPAPGLSYPSKDETADYLEAYAASFDLPVRSGVRVDRLFKEGRRFVVTAGDLRFEADNVVVATGAYHTPRVPEFASTLDPAIVQMHSSQYRDPSQLREGGVLVVGAGNSGAEIALESSRHHRTWLSGRDTGQEPTRAGSLSDRLFVPIMWFLASRVVDVRTPIGRKVRDQFLDPPRGIPLGRVRRKDIPAAGIERVPRTADVRDGYPVLDDGRILDVSNVIWCTGFVPDFSWIDLPVLGQNGFPIHTRGVVESEPGLYFMGLLFLSTLSSALVGGVGRDAQRIASHLMSTRSSRGEGRERRDEPTPAAS